MIFSKTGMICSTLLTTEVIINDIGRRTKEAWNSKYELRSFPCLVHVVSHYLLGRNYRHPSLHFDLLFTKIVLNLA